MKDIKKIENKFHKAIMGIKCCNGTVEYKKRIDRKKKQTIEMYSCPKCGSMCTKTLFFIDE